MKEIKLFDNKKDLNRQTIEESKQIEGLMNDFLVSQPEQEY